MFAKTAGWTAAALGLWGFALAVAAQEPENRTPRLLQPAAGSTLLPPVDFRWTVLRGAQSYQLQVSRDESFTPPPIFERSTPARGAQTDLPASGSYWWRVRAVFADGQSGPWSDARAFELEAPALAESVTSITLTPPSVSGGLSAQVVVTLRTPAPGRASVALSSSVPEVQVPARLIFSAGSTRAAADIGTQVVPRDVTARITATARQNSRSATFIVTATPPRGALTSFGVVPATPAAGNDVVGTVTLAAPAPAPSGTVVRIASSDAAASPPATVKVRPGGRAENFLIKTERSTANRTVTLTASLDETTRSVELTLRAADSGTPLDAPALLEPFEGVRAVEFSWGEVFGAVSYTLEISQSSGFEGPLIASRTVPFTEVRVTPLPSGLLWWRVRANDSSGAGGDWSAPRGMR